MQHLPVIFPQRIAITRVAKGGNITGLNNSTVLKNRRHIFSVYPMFICLGFLRLLRLYASARLISISIYIICHFKHIKPQEEGA
ncbi:hypothetical protein J4Q44_G00234150 [Coregonus suidteri]|uniref:Uncharacterized protein n=1 Tax=Coregonus suidteri TaxID=861788 RepID=A0AAN8LGZ0_9TELE